MFSNILLETCNNFVEDEIIAKNIHPIIIALDSADSLFDFPDIAIDFFAMLRSWHERSKIHEFWGHIKIIVTYSTDLYLNLDPNKSPFSGVGLEVNPQNFDYCQIQKLIDLHSLEVSGSEVSSLFKTLNGHPFLTRKAIYEASFSRRLSLSSLLEEAHTETGIYGDHLRSLIYPVISNQSLKAALNKAAFSPDPVSLLMKESFQLCGLGILTPVGNKTKISCEVYRKYLRDILKY